MRLQKARGLKFAWTTLAVFIILLNQSAQSNAQKLPRALMITGNGNAPAYKDEYPPWIHEFQNEKVVGILKNTANVDVTEDLTTLNTDNLKQYDLVISNSLFLEPTDEQLDALYAFVAGGKAYMTLHCGILSLLNWDKYEDFIGAIFIGGPSTVPPVFNVSTTNSEFWGYEYKFRKQTEHPVSRAVDDFEIRDELYYIEPRSKDFHVIARAENHPVMWWHPVGKGKVMCLTLGHDETAKNSPGYQALLRAGVQWLTGTPLILGHNPKIVSTRFKKYDDFLLLESGSEQNDPIEFRIAKNDSPDVITADASPNGSIHVTLTGKTGKAKFTVSASTPAGLNSARTFDFDVVRDGTGNIATYYGNEARTSSNENGSPVFYASNVMDGDPATRWSSAPAETAWLFVDLKKEYTIKKMVLNWEASYAAAYDVKSSVDGKTWTTIKEISDGDGGRDELSVNAPGTRYLRISMIRRAPDKWGYSLYDLEIFE